MEWVWFRLSHLLRPIVSATIQVLGSIYFLVHQDITTMAMMTTAIPTMAFSTMGIWIMTTMVMGITTIGIMTMVVIATTVISGGTSASAAILEQSGINIECMRPAFAMAV